MAIVVHRGTFEVHIGPNALSRHRLEPDGPWVSEPDVSAVLGDPPDKSNPLVPKRYWKWVGDVVVEMTQAEKDALDVAPPPSVVFHASSKIIDGEVEVTTPGPGWQLLGGVVANPGFFVKNPANAFGRIVFGYRTVGQGCRFRIREDDGTSIENLRTSPVLPDTADVWKTDTHVDTTELLRMTRNRYLIEAQLNGATSAHLGYASITLLELF